jgi:hypothetical protein
MFFHALSLGWSDNEVIGANRIWTKNRIVVFPGHRKPMEMDR